MADLALAKLRAAVGLGLCGLSVASVACKQPTTTSAEAPTAVHPKARCGSAPADDPARLYATCLECADWALARKELSVAEQCANRATELGHAEGIVGTAGKLEAWEARADVRLAMGDLHGARLDYYRALAAGRSRQRTDSIPFATLLEKAADTSTALGLWGEAFGALAEALTVTRALEGANSESSARLRHRIRDISRHLQM